MIVLKFGGSLTREKKAMRRLVNEIVKHSEKQLLVVPGGGIFADKVRELDRAYGLPPKEVHLMAILGMEQTGLLIASQSEKIRPTGSLMEIGRILRERKVPLILPSRILSRQEDLECTWDVTSDSIAAYITHRVGAKTLILLKDVDGVCTMDPKKERTARLLREVRAYELKRMRTSCVDKRFPDFVKAYGLGVVIINGRHPRRLARILSGKEAVSTKIIP